jgi:hypothetical protein
MAASRVNRVLSLSLRSGIFQRILDRCLKHNKLQQIWAKQLKWGFVCASLRKGFKVLSNRRKVAIGLPVYNGSRFIEGALTSLLDQSYSDFDLIISDNASTDQTEEICRDFARSDARIRYIRQEKNLGAVPNFNRVFELSDHEYFKWAAVDDFCHPSYLKKAVRVLDAHPEVVWCHARSSHTDEAGQLLDDPASLDVSYVEREASHAHDRFKAVLLGAKGCLDSYGLIRSSAIRKTPLFLPYYGPEKVFIAELALLGQYKEIQETLFFARVVAEGSGNRKTAEEQQKFIATNTPPFRLTRVNFLLGYLSAIRRSAPSQTDALRCRISVLQWLFQISKWRAVAIKTLRGQGVGAGNVERLNRIKMLHGQTADHAKGTVESK